MRSSPVRPRGDCGSRTRVAGFAGQRLASRPSHQVDGRRGTRFLTRTSGPFLATVYRFHPRGTHSTSLRPGPVCCSYTSRPASRDQRETKTRGSDPLVRGWGGVEPPRGPSPYSTIIVSLPRRAGIEPALRTLPPSSLVVVQCQHLESNQGCRVAATLQAAERPSSTTGIVPIQLCHSFAWTPATSRDR